jgi:hypothetical protein
MLIATCSLTRAQTGRVGMYWLQVSATPRQVAADGKSQARVRVEVKQHGGGAAPDGTQVVVHTDLGLLGLGTSGRQSSLNVRTAGGFATVYLTSSVPGTATVTAQALDSRNVTYVDFLPEGEVAEGEARVLDVSGGWVGYCMELGIIEARDRARVRFGKLTFESGTVLQINIETLTLRAQDVVVRRGEATLQGEDLYFDLAAKRGVLRRFGAEQLERVFFDGVGLRPLQTEWDLPNDAFRMDGREADSWLVARTINFFPHEKIVLRNASLYVQTQKVFAFPPYWIIGMPGYSGASNTQSLGMTSSGGLAVDFPFFYRVTDKATGAIRIQHGTRSGFVASRQGWSFAVCEEYRSGNGVEGTVEFSGLPRDDWGFEWRDARPVLGDGFGYFNLALPDHQSIFADFNAYDYMPGGRINARAYYDAPVDGFSDYGLVGDYLRDPRYFSQHGTYRLGLSAGVRQYAGESSPVFVNELYSEVDLGRRPFSKRTTFAPVLTNVFSWDTSGFAENAARADLELTHNFSPSFRLGLDYNAEWRQGNVGRNGLAQVVGLDLHAHHGSKWTSYLSTNYNITQDSLYGYLTFNYALSDKWRTGLTATYLQYGDTAWDDIELSIGRNIGDRQVNLLYSTATGRFAVSLGGFALR